MRKPFRAVLSVLILGALVTSTLPSAIGAEPNPKSKKTYWTLEKIMKAKPYEMVFDGKSKFAKRVTVQNSQRQTPPDPNLITGLPWTENGVIESSTGKVFFTIGSAGYTCSGTLVNETETSKAIVLTAGHCVFEQAVDGGQYVTNWIYIRNFEKVGFSSQEGCTPERSCWGTDLLTADSIFEGEVGYTDLATQHDWGFATITSTTELPDTSIPGLYPLKINGFSAAGDESTSFGYPAQGKFKGRDLIYCKAPIIEDRLNDSATWGMRCDMTGGSSGGPWISRFGSQDAGLSSVNSYKYINDRKRMYGPKFSSVTLETFQSALNK